MGLNRQLANLPDAITTDTSNNVGIGGAANASFKLQVTGAATFSSSVSTGGALNITVPYSAGTMTILTQDNLGNGIYLAPRSNLNFDYGVANNTTGIINNFGYQNGSAHFRSLGIGDGKGGTIAFFDGVNSRVGIGTPSPQSIVHASVNNATAPTSGTTPSGYGLSFGSGDGYNGGLWFSSDFGGDQGIAGIAATRVSGYTTDLRFYTNSTNSARAFTERMRITSGGNVLIGTTSSANTGLGTKTKQYIVGDGSTNAAASHGSMFVAAGTGTADTGISVNQGTAGMTMILIASINTSTGTSTNSAVYIVRFYFSGNNTPTATYIGGSSDFVTFSTSGSNTLNLTGSSSGNKSYAWFVNKFGDV